jgi:hypothetical protein
LHHRVKDESNVQQAAKECGVEQPGLARST